MSVRCVTLPRSFSQSLCHGDEPPRRTARTSERDRRTLARLVARALRRRRCSPPPCSSRSPEACSSGLPPGSAGSSLEPQMADNAAWQLRASLRDSQTAVHAHDRCEYSRHRGRRRAVRLWRRAALWPHSASSVSARACQPRVQSVGSHARAHAARSHSGATVVALLASPTPLLTALAPPLPVAGSARQAREGDQGPRPHWPDRLGDPGAR